MGMNYLCSWRIWSGGGGGGGGLFPGPVNGRQVVKKQAGSALSTKKLLGLLHLQVHPKGLWACVSLLGIRACMRATPAGVTELTCCLLPRTKKPNRSYWKRVRPRTLVLSVV